MSVRYAEMAPEEQKAFVAKERKFIEKEKEQVREGREYEWHPEVAEVQKVIPSGNWRGPFVTDGTICAKRDVEIQRYSSALEDYAHVKFTEEEQCVNLPDTAQCVTQKKDKAKDACELAKVAFACADESAGMLTPLQVAGLTDIEHGKAKACIRQLESEGLVEAAPVPFGGKALSRIGGEGGEPILVSRRTYDTRVGAHGQPVKEVTSQEAVGGERNEWLGESYYAMKKETREKTLSELGTS